VKKPLDDAYLVEKIREIEANLKSGDGMAIAKKKVFKSHKLSIVRELMLHPLYIIVLNNYLESKGRGRTFFIKDGKIMRGKKNFELSCAPHPDDESRN